MKERSDGAGISSRDLGPAYSRGSAFRARAELRQREYRLNGLEVGYKTYGHWLDDGSAARGYNFFSDGIHRQVKAREAAGKGVADRTYYNMLSSQAMCFNLFGPLEQRRDLASAALSHFIPGLISVEAIYFEYTPDADVFRDQSGRGGVDCDLLLEVVFSKGEEGVVVIETKFVEPEFSVCGFVRGKDGCSDIVPVKTDRSACLYVSRKRYLYWQRSDELGTLDNDALSETRCPFRGNLWQLWVNHTLAHHEARSRGAPRAVFAVCAPMLNDTLLQGGKVLEDFRSLVREPETVILLPVEGLIAALSELVDSDRDRDWTEYLRNRYAGFD